MYIRWKKAKMHYKTSNWYILTLPYLLAIRYEKKSLTWTQKLSNQLNLAQVDRKKNMKKEETKTSKRQCPLNSVQVQDPWRQSGRNKSDYGGKDLWKRWVLSLEWKAEGTMDGESKGVDCDGMICTEWSERGGQWTE